MSIYIPTITSRHNREELSVAGNAVTKLFSTAALPQRAGVEIANRSASYYLWIRAVARGSAAPTIASTTTDWELAPGATITLNYGSALDIYVENSSGGAATDTVIAYEVLT